MHELGIAEGVLDVTRGLAGDRGVRRVAIRVGVRRPVSLRSLEVGFEMLAMGTGAEGAHLTVRRCAGDDILVDEIRLDGDPPAVLRRPGYAAHLEARELEGRRAPQGTHATAR